MEKINLSKEFGLCFVESGEFGFYKIVNKVVNKDFISREEHANNNFHLQISLYISY